jgi:hypothetical protein
MVRNVTDFRMFSSDIQGFPTDPGLRWMSGAHGKAGLESPAYRIVLAFLLQ